MKIYHSESKNKDYQISVDNEDAIIGRDLFDASDYINAVRFGMELAKMGYDDIEECWPEDDS